MPNQYTTPPAFITCETCGKTVRIKAYELTTARFCSRKCQGGPRPTHGHARNGQRAPEYNIWCAMLSRCQNPNNPFYSDYGGRGIVVCAAWHDYARFIEDVGRRPSPDLSIDRLDRDGDYEPGNVAWRTRTQQQRNKRDNAWLTAGGERRLRIEWAELTGIPHTTIRNRLTSGWSPEQAVGFAPPPPRARRRLTVGGVTRLIVEWSKVTGIDAEVINARLRIGWSPERAVTIPARAPRPRRR